MARSRSTPPITLPKLGEALDAMLEGVVVVSKRWRCLHVNKAAARQVGARREDLLGQRLLDQVPALAQPPVSSALERCMKERRADQLEVELDLGEGRRTWLQLGVRPWPGGLVIVSVDVTGHRRQRELQERTHQFLGMSQIARGLVHYVGNLLNPISVHLQLIERKVRDQPQLIARLEQMSAVLSRGVQMLDRVRLFALQTLESEAPMLLPLDNAVRNALANIRPQLEEHPAPISIQLELGRDVRPVVGREPHLSAAIAGILVNAIEALPQGGTITLRTGDAESGPWLTIEDDGAGMRPETAARAFEALFTTRGQRSTGLGLTNVRALMTRCGGRVELESARDEGTTVTLGFATDPAHLGTKSDA